MSLYHVGAIQESWSDLRGQALAAAKKTAGHDAVSWVNYDGSSGAAAFTTASEAADAYGRFTDKPMGRKAVLLYSTDAQYQDGVRDYAVFQPSEGTRQSPIAWVVAGLATVGAILGIAASKGKH